MGARIESRVGFGLRLAASLIDLVMITVGGLIIGTLSGGLLGSIFGSVLGTIEGIEGIEGTVEGAELGGIIGIILGAAIGIFVFGALYNLLEGFVGATVGKMLIGIKIGNDDGTKAGVGKLMFRYIIKNIAFVSSLLAGIVGITLIAKTGSLLGFIWFLGCFLVLGSARQGLHDMIAKTAVYPRKVLK